MEQIGSGVRRLSYTHRKFNSLKKSLSKTKNATKRKQISKKLKNMIKKQSSMLRAFDKIHSRKRSTRKQRAGAVSPNLPSAKQFLPGTKKKVDGKTYMVVGSYNNFGKILKSTQHWTKLTNSNRKYLDTKNTVAKLHKSKSKLSTRKRVSRKRVSRK